MFDFDSSEDGIRDFIRQRFGDDVLATAERVSERYEALQPQVNAIVNEVGQDDSPVYVLTLTGREIATLLGGLGAFLTGDLAPASIVYDAGRNVFDALDTASSLVACVIGNAVPDEIPSWLTA
jgi:hypothetical protein